MQNKNQDMNKGHNSSATTEKLHRKIKETWSGLADSDIKLYDGKRDEFFANLKQKLNVSTEDAKKKMQKLEKDCGYTSTAKAA